MHMRIIRDYQYTRPEDRGASAAIGNFDGVHLGPPVHQGRAPGVRRGVAVGRRDRRLVGQVEHTRSGMGQRSMANLVQKDVGDVVQPAHEGRDEGSPGLCRQEGLEGGEAEGHVDANSLIPKSTAGFQPVLGERDLDDDVRVDLRQIAALRDHLLRVGRRDLGRDQRPEQADS